MKKGIKGFRTFGTIGMVALFLLFTILLGWLGFIGMISLTGGISLLITAIIGSIIVAIATKKKEGLLAYVNIFLTVMLVSLIVAGIVAFFTGLF